MGGIFEGDGCVTGVNYFKTIGQEISERHINQAGITVVLFFPSSFVTHVKFGKCQRGRFIRNWRVSGIWGFFFLENRVFIRK